MYYLKCVCLIQVVNNEFVLESRDVIYDRINLLFTTFQAKGFPPTSAKCTENHWLVKDVSDSLPEKRSKKKQPFHTLPQYLYSINKYEIENSKSD